MIVINCFTTDLGTPPIERVFDKYLAERNIEKRAETTLENTVGAFFDIYKGTCKIHALYEMLGCAIKTWEHYDVWRSPEQKNDAFTARIVFEGKNEVEESEKFYQKFKDSFKEIRKKVYKIAPSLPETQVTPSDADCDNHTLDEKAGEAQRPIFNPNGSNMLETEELVKALSTVLASDTWSGVKNYTLETIRAVVKGYEEQSGQRYTGFFPEQPKLAEQGQK
jgi:hypothetical protein